MTTRLDGISELYEAALVGRASRLAYRCEELELFSKAVDVLGRAVDQEDEFWRGILGRMGRLRFSLLTTLLPSSTPELQIESCLEKLTDDLRAIDQRYPGLETYATSCLFRLRQLGLSEGASLHAVLTSVVEQTNPASITLLTRAVALVEVLDRCARDVIPSEIDLRVVGGRSTDDGTISDLIVVLGPFKWYRPALWEAPRAPALISACASFISESALRFTGLPGLTENRLVPLHTDDTTLTGPEVGDAIDGENLIPQFDLHRAARSDAAGVQQHDLALAHGVVLAGELMLWLDAAPHSSCLILNVSDTAAGRRITRIPTARVASGMFVVVRTEGGGDYIQEVADSVLGESARDLRRLQAEWKAPLARLVEMEGPTAVAAKLYVRGGTLATAGNVRRWCSPDSLRTEHRSDFDAIMTLTGMASRSDQYWNAMGLIDSAHLRAGTIIRRLLEEQMISADLAQMRARGRADFELPNTVGGMLSAIRVEDSSDKTHTVPRHRLGKPFPAPF